MGVSPLEWPGRDERALLRDSYPYVLLRSVIVFVLLAAVAAVLILLLIVISSLFNHGGMPNFWLLILL